MLHEETLEIPKKIYFDLNYLSNHDFTFFGHSSKIHNLKLLKLFLEDLKNDNYYISHIDIHTLSANFLEILYNSIIGFIDFKEILNYIETTNLKTDYVKLVVSLHSMRIFYEYLDKCKSIKNIFTTIKKDKDNIEKYYPPLKREIEINNIDLYSMLDNIGSYSLSVLITYNIEYKNTAAIKYYYPNLLEKLKNNDLPRIKVRRYNACRV